MNEKSKEKDRNALESRESSVRNEKKGEQGPALKPEPPGPQACSCRPRGTLPASFPGPWKPRA